MALVRFSTGTPYGCVEMNHATWPRDGRVPSQLPLSATDFASTRCENGAWLVYNEIAKEVQMPKALTDTVGLVYSAEKDYGVPGARGLGHFSQGAGEMPRVGRPVIGDKYTTNTFQYDDSAFTTEAAIQQAFEGGTALYLIPTVGSAIPTLTTTIGTATTVARVIKWYTVPNGQPGIKVEFIKVNA